jgi:large subunit ribosomal protein L14
MIQLGTILRITDRTGVVIAQCIKILNVSKYRVAKIGDIFLISVKGINVKRLSLAKPRIQKKYQFGTIHRVILLRSKTNYQPFPGIHYKFNENAGIIISKKKIAQSNRVYGPILRNICLQYPWLGCISRIII